MKLNIDVIIKILEFTYQTGPIMIIYDFNINKFIEKENPVYVKYKKILYENGFLLGHIDINNQTEELCKIAVQNDGYSLVYVENQTDEICKLAVKQNGFALQHVKNQTDEICNLAVYQNGHALQHVKNKTKEIRRLSYLRRIPPTMCDLEVSKTRSKDRISKTLTKSISAQAYVYYLDTKFSNNKIIINNKVILNNKNTYKCTTS
jgi:hypothetical protein